MFQTNKSPKNGFAFVGIIVLVFLILTLIAILFSSMFAEKKFFGQNQLLKEGVIKTAYAANDDTGYFNSGYMFDNNAATAEELNKYFKDNNIAFDKDKLGEDLGLAIKNAADKYHINPVYIAAHAMLETGRNSLSPIAKEKKNIFGFMAYDRDAYGNAKTFSSYGECVNYVMSYIKNEYLTPGGDWYEGETLEAMNKHYATDQGWAQKIKNIMLEIYRDIGKTPPNLAAK